MHTHTRTHTRTSHLQTFEELWASRAQFGISSCLVWMGVEHRPDAMLLEHRIITAATEHGLV